MAERPDSDVAATPPPTAVVSAPSSNFSATQAPLTETNLSDVGSGQASSTMITQASSTSNDLFPSNSKFASLGSSIASNQINTFTCFPKLAVEIRRMVWKQVCFQPRNIALWRDTVELNHECSGINLDHSVYYIRPNSQPAILRTCQESRNIGLKNYTLEFGISTTRNVVGTEVVMSNPARIYVNWVCDTVVLMRDDYTGKNYLCGAALGDTNSSNSIHRVAYNADTIFCRDSSEPQVLPNVREVILFILEKSDVLEPSTVSRRISSRLSLPLLPRLPRVL